MTRYVLRTRKKPYKYVNLYWQLVNDIMDAQVYRESTATKYSYDWNGRQHWGGKKGLIEPIQIEIKEI